MVEVPHAGLVIDAQAAAHTRIPPPAEAARALLADSDIGADRLWRGAESSGITLVIARTSRYVVDLNTEPRLPDRYEEALPAPLREVLHISNAGVQWRALPPPREELERRLREVFEPYHAAVAAALERARARHGWAVLISAHTFAAGCPANAVIGTRHGATVPAGMADAFADALALGGLSVAREEPFPGGHSLARHARPHEGVLAVQIEIARRLICGAPLEIDETATARVGALLLEACRRIVEAH